MTMRALLEERLEDNFVTTDRARLGGLGEFYQGKVRDLYLGDSEITMITTDRLSAFDVVLTSIPCKGAILNAISLEAFRETEDICSMINSLTRWGACEVSLGVSASWCDPTATFVHTGRMGSSGSPRMQF